MDPDLGLTPGRRPAPTPAHQPESVSTADRRAALAVWLGRMAYQPAWDLQRQLVEARTRGAVPDVLLFVEHPPTYTLGRRGDPAHLLLDKPGLQAQGIEYLEVDRGGDITYHGPGQLVGYPILDLSPWNQDLHRYVRMLEEALIRALAGYGLEAGREPGYTGVWVKGEKVAAIGIKVSRGVAHHGFALNVETDLRYFRQIIPCGIADRGVTSLAALLGLPVRMGEVRSRVEAALSEVFGFETEAADLADLEKALQATQQ